MMRDSTLQADCPAYLEVFGIIGSADLCAAIAGLPGGSPLNISSSNPASSQSVTFGSSASGGGGAGTTSSSSGGQGIASGGGGEGGGSPSGGGSSGGGGLPSWVEETFDQFKESARESGQTYSDAQWNRLHDCLVQQAMNGLSRDRALVACLSTQ